MFGAEFVAMKIITETLRGIRYKLRMMDVPISVPLYIYGDNMSVINEFNLKNNSNSIFYHDVHKSVAVVESLTGHVGTN